MLSLVFPALSEGTCFIAFLALMASALWDSEASTLVGFPHIREGSVAILLIYETHWPHATQQKALNSEARLRIAQGLEGINLVARTEGLYYRLVGCWAAEGLEPVKT